MAKLVWDEVKSDDGATTTHFAFEHGRPNGLYVVVHDWAEHATLYRAPAHQWQKRTHLGEYDDLATAKGVAQVRTDQRHRDNERLDRRIRRGL